MSGCILMAKVILDFSSLSLSPFSLRTTSLSRLKTWICQQQPMTAGVCREHPSHSAWLTWWFWLQNIWTSVEFGWQSILQWVGYTGEAAFDNYVPSSSRVCTWVSVVDNELYWKCWQTSPPWLVIFSELVTSVSSDNTAAGPRMSYTKSTNFCSLRKMKGSVFGAAITHILSGLCTVRFVLQIWPGVAYTSHQVINGSLRCLPFLIGLVLFYPKDYHEIP